MIETSPFVHNKKLFSAMVNDAKKKNAPVWLPYTLTRGCPYACTFCDWNSGLGNKVSRRKNTYQQEIDLFQKLNLKNIYLSDANVGQYDEDVDMVEYFAEKNLKENAGFRISGNYSKLNKKNNLKIFNIMAESGLVQQTLNFSIQDINEEILHNIDRPDVGWDVHVAMADELREKYPHLIVKTQLICGLPGQTVESWRQTMQQIVAKNILPNWFVNEPLPASPAIYDPEYQRKWNFEYDKVTRIDLQANHYVGIVPKKCISFSQHDLVKMIILSGICEAVSLINLTMMQHFKLRIDTEFIIDNLLSSEGYSILCDNLYSNWINEQKFYLTQDFAGNTTTSCSCEVGFAGYSLLANETFILQIKNLLLENQKEQLSYLNSKKILLQYVLKIFTELA